MTFKDVIDLYKIPVQKIAIELNKKIVDKRNLKKLK